MAGKKGSKSSKTDHVLNLISGMTPNQESSPPAPEKDSQPLSSAGKAAAAAAPSAQSIPAETTAAEGAAPAPSAPFRAAPILEVARTNHEALSETVHQALENALEEELREEEKQQAASPDSEANSPAADLQEPPAPPSGEPLPASAEPDSQEPPAPQPDSAREPGSRPAPESTAAPENVSSAPAAQTEKAPSKQTETDIVNVMQILVTENLDRYVNMFQVCRCSRCLADVQALALTNLPAKYVVMDHGKLSSMLGFYRHRYATSVMIELTKACNVVKQNPHHDL